MSEQNTDYFARLINLKEFTVTCGHAPDRIEKGNENLKKRLLEKLPKIFSSSDIELLKTHSLSEIILLEKLSLSFSENYNELRKIRIVAPITCEPNPPILGIIATVAHLVETIRSIAPKLDDEIHIKFLFWGNNIYDIKVRNDKCKEHFKKQLGLDEFILRSEFKKHFSQYLPDTREDTIKNLIRLRQVEFKTFIKNIFLEINWNDRFPRALIRNTEFGDIFTEEKIEVTTFSSTIREEISKITEKTILIDDNPCFQEIKKELYRYNNHNSDDPTSHECPPPIEIAMHMLNRMSSAEDIKCREFLVLPETGYNIILNLAKLNWIKKKYPSLNTGISNSLVWFTEIDRGSSPFPTYYNELSKYYLPEKEKINELYFAGLLENLNCKLFSTDRDSSNTQFQIIVAEINQVREDLKTYQKKFLRYQELSKNPKFKDDEEDNKDSEKKYLAKYEATAEIYEKYSAGKIRAEIFRSIESGFLNSQNQILQQFELII